MAPAWQPMVAAANAEGAAAHLGWPSTLRTRSGRRVQHSTARTAGVSDESDHPSAVFEAESPLSSSQEMASNDGGCLPFGRGTNGTFSASGDN